MAPTRDRCDSSWVHLRRETRAAIVAAVMLAGSPVLTLPAPAHAAPAAKVGSCTIVGTSGDDLLVGTAADDVICGLGGDDKILGRDGDDVLRGGGGRDVVRGGPGFDRVSGGRGEDRVFGQSGDDVVRGDAGDDQVVGGPGNDRLGGFRGADQMKSAGDAGGFVDDVRCGPGPDTASADPADEVRHDCETVTQNDPPTDITLVPTVIFENEPIGSDIGALTAVDPDVGDSHIFSLVPGVGSADNGLVRIDGDSLESAVRYDFETDSSLSVRVRATDDAGESTEKAFTITVADANDAPVAVDDDATATEDTQLDLPVSGAGSPAANDTDQDGDPLTVAAVSSPTGGTVSISAGEVHFVPAANLCGNNAGSFVYTVSDGGAPTPGSDTGLVTVDITCVNDAPVAVDDNRTVGEDSTATTLNVLSNDTDVENDPITIASFTDPAGGTVELVGPVGVGTNLTYVPNADFCNDPPPFDTFDYTVNGGDTATVRVTVTCVNDPPVAIDDDRTATEDTPFSDPVTGAGSPAANDNDVDGDPLTVTAVSNPTGGSVAIASGQITFTPAANLCGPNTGAYDYTVSDGAAPTAGTDTGTVTIDLTCVNDAPVANDDSRTVAEDSGPTTFITLRDNDTDVESDPITITGASDPANGATTFTTADVTYTPDANFCGADSFTYIVNGGDTATVSVTVTCVNDAPVAHNDLRTVAEDAPATALTVLGNDTDVENDPITIISASDPANGTVVLTGGSSGAHTGLTYEPDENYCNAPPDTTPDTFTYTVNGGDTATVSVTVTCVDDAPVAVDDSASLNVDDPATAIPVLVNDTDIDGGSKAIASASDPANGTVLLTGGTPGAHTGLTYEPDAGYCNTENSDPDDTFTYTLTPGGDSATVSVEVVCDVPPVGVDDAATVDEDSAATAIDVLANDTNPDGGPKVIASSADPVNGTVVLTGGTPGAHTGLTYQPDPDYCNDPPGTTPDTFDYTLNGGDTATVSVTVTCVDDDPTANDDSDTVAEDSGATPISVLANDDNDDGGLIEVTDASDPANGSTTFSASSVSYTPDPNYCGADSFTYTVNGGDTATVSVTVTCVNDAPAVDLDTETAGNGSASTFVETDPHTGTGVLIAPNVDIADLDDTQLESATVTLTNRPDGAGEAIAPPASLPPGITVTSTTGPGGQELLITGPAPIADFEAVIAGIRYDNTVNPPNLADRVITVVVNDGDADSVSRTATVQVMLDNEAPVNTVPGAQTTAEDTSLPFTGGSAISVADADDANLNVEVTVTHGIFTLSGTAGLTVTGDGTANVTMDGAIADLNAALNNATFTPDADYNGPALLTIVTSDGSSSDTDTVDITVTAVNDAPTGTNRSAGETYTEDVPLNLVNIVVSDVDNANLTVTLTLSNPTAGSLSTATSGSVTSTYNAGSGEWAASGAIADVNTLLAGVIFTPAPDFNASFSIDTSVTDGIAAALTGSKTMTGTPVNDPPVNGVPGAQSVDEDVDLVFTGGNALTVADVDGGSLTIQVTVTDGTFTLSGTAGLSGVTGDGTDVVGATGSIANLNAALAGSKYRGTLDYFGPAQLTLDTSDGLVSDNDSVAITVNPVNDAPVADDETLTVASGRHAVGNTTLGVGTSPAEPRKTIGKLGEADVLAGDSDIDGPGPLVVTSAGSNGAADDGLTQDGGTVTIAANGDFTYTPAANDPGCTDGTDSFDYVVSDQFPGTAGTDIGTVTIEVATCVWYVDSAVAGPGTGTSSDPFQALSGLNATATDADGSGDRIMILDAAAYSGGLTLEDDQVLRSRRAGLVMPSGHLIVSAAGASNPTISNAAGDALTLASGNTIQGIDLGSTAAGFAALAGSGVGTATMNTVTSGLINNATGGAVNISNGTLAMAFTSVASDNATNDGIRLDNTAGTFTASGGALQNAGGQDVDLSGNSSGDSVDFTYDGTITDDVGQLVNVSGQSGGTKDFNGAITDGNDGDGNGISLTNNTGATTRFDGGLTLSSGGNAAFAATGGGTVVVTGSANTLATSTGTALTVADTTIGADGLTFLSISSNGAPNGIVLSNTGSTAGLTVTGNGGTCTNADTSGCSGGRIRNTTGADSSGATPTGTGIVLNNTLAPSFTRIWLHDHSNYAIRGTSVNGFTLANSVINGVNGNNGVDPFSDSSVRFFNASGVGLQGSASVTNTHIEGGREDNFRVSNTSGSLNRLTFDAVTIGANSTAEGNDGIVVEGTGTATVNVTLQNSTLTSSRGDLFQMTADGSGGGDLDFISNTLSNNHPGIGTGGGGVSLFGGATAGGTFDITMSGTNTFRDAVGHAILVVKTFGGGSMNGSIDNITVGQDTAGDNSGSLEGSAIKLQHAGGGGTASVDITNSTFREYNNFGIELQSGAGVASSGTLSLNVTGNTVTDPGSNPNVTGFQGVALNSGVAPGDTFSSCLHLKSNSVAGSGSPDLPAVDIRVRARQSTTVTLPGYAGDPTDTAAIATFLANQNDAAPNDPGANPPVPSASATKDAGATYSGAGSTCP